MTAEVVYGSNACADFFLLVRDIIGGPTGSYERVSSSGQRCRIQSNALASLGA